MNEFLGTVPILRIALGFDMKTMHFHIAQTSLFLGQFGTHEILSWDARYVKLASRLILFLWKYNMKRLV